MTIVRSSSPVLDESGAPAVGNDIYVINSATGALVAKGTTSNGLEDVFVFDRSASLTNTSSGWNNYTLRTRVETSLLSYGGAIRVGFKAPASAAIVLGSMYVGVGESSSASLNFAGTPTQLLFGGASGTTVAAGGTVLSDETVFELSGTSPIVVSAYFSGATALSSTSGYAGIYCGFALGDSAGTTGSLSFSGAGGTSYGLHRIEVIRDVLPAGEYSVNCGSFTGEVLVVCKSADPDLRDLIHRTTPV